MRLKQIKPQKGITKEKARLLARLKADGSVFKSNTDYVVSYDSSNLQEIQRTSSDISKVYGLRVKILRHRSGKNPQKLLYKMFVRSKLMYEDLLLYGKYRSENWEVPTEILNAIIDIKREFLRTFFEDEGTVLKNEIRLYSINKIGLTKIQELLREFEIESVIRGGFGLKRNVHAISIGKKQERAKFSSLIGFLSEEKNRKLSNFLSG
ncbi:MAG: hypothetical protein GTN38_01230 [Candidatus Aenigmarchaeota archaeon]|nr:hypothetical protein [Candidatus Aenigmarchaeota archaeon]NIQ17750.1 hypothetical protein [Candidatus Aenigmarchaeota archaeon]NIS73070.1 hypothetical protein [Candidatus Aenigmarchaeota archaeon]